MSDHSTTIRLCATTLLVALAALVAGACGPGESAGTELSAIEGVDERRLEVVATTNFVADMVREIGGDRVEVTALMGPGVDPHVFRASASDVDAIANADAVFYVGLDLEAKLQDVLEESGRPAVAITSEIDEDQLLDAPGSDLPDPHVWFDPELWATTPDVVADALATLDPGSADEYAERGDEYEQAVLEEGERAARTLEAVPERARVLVTSHDAFSYFGRAFDFEVEAIQGISTVTEATADDVERISDIVIERELGAVFVESSVSGRTIEAVVEAAAAGGVTVEVGGSLYSDAAGPEGTFEGTYPGMLRANVETIAAGLA